MHVGGIALGVIGACAAYTMPTALWQDADRLNVLCLVNGPRGVDQDAARRLCARVVALASRGAPIPVAIVEAGDPALLSPDSVTLLIHATLTANQLVFALRPFRNDGNPLLFSAAPQVVSRDDAGALDAVLAQSLAELLPWRVNRAARPLDPAGRPLGRGD